MESNWIGKKESEASELKGGEGREKKGEESGEGRNNNMRREEADGQKRLMNDNKGE